MLGRALPNGNAFVGSAIFPKLPSLYGFLQKKGYFLFSYFGEEQNWVKTVISALRSGQNNLQRPIWGCHRQLHR